MRMSDLQDRVVLLLIALTAFAALIADGGASARSAYASEGAKACTDCHGNAEVMGIMDTAHFESSDPGTPAAQKECQSCHGPSATHIQFPMQVANLHFGKASKTKPEVQNKMCLECHEDGERTEWRASAHGFNDVVCSSCHSIHDPDRVLPSTHAVTGKCESCHDDLMKDAQASDFSHAVGRDLGSQGELNCAGCHNPHGPLRSDRCAACHPRSAEVLAKESEKARRFHEVAERKGTECMRCHKGIAHPIPPLVLQQSQEAMERLVQ